MNGLIDIEKDYRDSFKATFEVLKKTQDDILNNYQFDLSKTEISEAILERLKNYFVYQDKTKEFLNKRYKGSAADYFVETIIFYLRIYLNSIESGLSVHSEMQIEKRRNSIRPDISIWKESDLVAIIECKTQLGWSRNNWEEEFNNRDTNLRKIFPNAKSYLLVMTENNWGGFKQSENQGKRYFSLLKKEIGIIDYSQINQISIPIENLFRLISI